MNNINSIKPVFSDYIKKKKIKDTDSIFKKYKTQKKNTDKILEISVMDIIKIFIKYDIPVATETLEALKEYPYYYIEKDDE